MATNADGYGYRHRKQRRAYARLVEAGRAMCVRCGDWIEPGSDWHLDHTDDRAGYLGPSHASCNTSDGARKTNAIRRMKAGMPPMPQLPRTSRRW